jgi:parvulin-like peptidyl-prolyl isomerase
MDRIMAEVNGEIILQSEVDERLFQMRTSGQQVDPDDSKAYDAALDSMIDEKLIIQFGKEKEIKIQDKEIQNAIDRTRRRMGVGAREFKAIVARQGLTMERYRSTLEDQILAGRVLSMEVRSQVSLLPETIEEYYNKFPEKFKTEVVLKVRHILIMLGEDALEAEADKAFEKIRSIRKRVTPKNFVEVALDYSQGPSAKEGGNLGEVRPGEMVKSFEKAAFSLKPGVISEPVRTRFGYHLILVENRTEPIIPPFKEVKGAVEQRIYNELLSEVREEWLNRLKKKGYIDKKTGN